MIETVATAVIVGFMSGGFGTYVAVQVMKVKIENLSEKVSRLENKVFSIK